MDHLTGRQADAGSLLGLRRQESQRRKIEETGPALTKGPGNLGNFEMVEGEGAVQFLQIPDRIQNIAAEMIEHGPRTGQG